MKPMKKCIKFPIILPKKRTTFQKQQLLLTDNAGGRYTLSASKEALKSLKELIEK